MRCIAMRQIRSRVGCGWIDSHLCFYHLTLRMCCLCPPRYMPLFPFASIAALSLSGNCDLNDASCLLLLSFLFHVLKEVSSFLLRRIVRSFHPHYRHLTCPCHCFRARASPPQRLLASTRSSRNAVVSVPLSEKSGTETRIVVFCARVAVVPLVAKMMPPQWNSFGVAMLGRLRCRCFCLCVLNLEATPLPSTLHHWRSQLDELFRTPRLARTDFW
mmetsp:Transcript_9157/g.17915  ORF Transcript_9157/g.17915 Transcript_9157/m.17915 type:complete len:216 (-) Transcript_9157:374-1021(-)